MTRGRRVSGATRRGGKISAAASAASLGSKSGGGPGTAVMLAIDQLCLDFQPHKNLIEPAVEEIIEQMRRGERIEPVTVCCDGARYLLKDGFHRVEAARRLEHREISAEVFPGTLEKMEAEFRQGFLEDLKRDLRREAHEAAAGKSAPRRKRGRRQKP